MDDYAWLGAEEEKSAGDKTLDVIKEVGPSLVTSIQKAIEGKPASPPLPPPPAASPMPTWGWALVGVGAAALVGGLVYVGARK